MAGLARIDKDWQYWQGLAGLARIGRIAKDWQGLAGLPRIGKRHIDRLKCMYSSERDRPAEALVPSLQSNQEAAPLTMVYHSPFSGVKGRRAQEQARRREIGA